MSIKTLNIFVSFLFHAEPTPIALSPLFYGSLNCELNYLAMSMPYLLRPLIYYTTLLLPPACPCISNCISNVCEETPQIYANVYGHSLFSGGGLVA